MIIIEKYMRPIIAGVLILALGLLVLTVAKCGTVDHTAERQAEQTEKSGAAIAGAASAAIETIGDRNATERDIDNVVQQASEAIGMADNPGAVHDAVVAGLCGQASHSDDPACKLR